VGSTTANSLHDPRRDEEEWRWLHGVTCRILRRGISQRTTAAEQQRSDAWAERAGVQDESEQGRELSSLALLKYYLARSVKGRWVEEQRSEAINGGLEWEGEKLLFLRGGRGNGSRCFHLQERGMQARRNVRRD
jgi:hypothetical protein